MFLFQSKITVNSVWLTETMMVDNSAISTIIVSVSQRLFTVIFHCCCLINYGSACCLVCYYGGAYDNQMKKMQRLFLQLQFMCTNRKFLILIII